MNIAVLGTGMVGRAHAARLKQLGHDVVLGTRDPQAATTQEHTSVGEWRKDHGDIEFVPFVRAAAHGDIVLNALKGDVSIAVLETLERELAGKVLVDIANPLDFSKGMPPSLFVSNSDSLGEDIQRALPATRVVKAFNTLTAELQVDPTQLNAADHDLFLCGNDADAKEKVSEIARSYGWKNIIDLGDITNARGTEMFLPLWLRLWGALNTSMFNVKIVK